jgi:integrase
MNKRTVVITTEEYNAIIDTMRKGFAGCRANDRVATALVLEANLGLRVSDILNLKLSDIIRDGERYRLDITEQKTGKRRVFTVLNELYNYIKIYCLESGIQPHERIFPITERAVQRHLKLVCDYLGMEGVSTHSFRKYFATAVYTNSDYNIVVVQRLLQHSTPGVTQAYIGLEPKAIEDALKKQICLR